MNTKKINTIMIIPTKPGVGLNATSEGDKLEGAPALPLADLFFIRIVLDMA